MNTKKVPYQLGYLSKDGTFINAASCFGSVQLPTFPASCPCRHIHFITRASGVEHRSGVADYYSVIESTCSREGFLRMHIRSHHNPSSSPVAAEDYKALESFPFLPISAFLDHSTRHPGLHRYPMPALP